MWRIAGVLSAVSLKLSSSIDDVVWLAPFLTKNASHVAKMHNAAIYIGICLMQTLVAMAIAYSGDRLVALLTHGDTSVWSSEKILTVAAGSLLALYSLKLAHEYFTEDGDGDRDSKDPLDELHKVGGEDALIEDCEAQRQQSLRKHIADISLDESDGEETTTDPSGDEKAEAGRTKTLFVIAFLGSVDDLTLFVPMLAGKGFNLFELVFGGFIASAMIVCLCMFVGMCKPVANCLSSVPLAAIVVTFAVMLLIKGFMMD